ncbi:MAG: hypothetical protein IJU79_02295 [Desulfovibrionaceae bacterium]|nr:hypothetical protein [Desulfovibrionaceae bacterium]
MKIIAKLFALLFKKVALPVDPETAKTEAQIAVEEARAFRKGKLTPRYLFKYAMIFLSVLFCTLLILGLFFPSLIDTSNLLETIERMFNIIGGV